MFICRSTYTYTYRSTCRSTYRSIAGIVYILGRGINKICRRKCPRRQSANVIIGRKKAHVLKELNVGLHTQANQASRDVVSGQEVHAVTAIIVALHTRAKQATTLSAAIMPKDFASVEHRVISSTLHGLPIGKIHGNTIGFFLKHH